MRTSIIHDKLDKASDALCGAIEQYARVHKSTGCYTSHQALDAALAFTRGYVRAAKNEVRKAKGKL